MQMLNWLWGHIELDPFKAWQASGASPTGSSVRDWLARLTGAPPVPVSVKEEAV